MFTGLIQAVGRVSDVQNSNAGVRLLIEASFSSDLELGESVAVNGVCLTVTASDKNSFGVDIVPESLDRSALFNLKMDDHVNLERALKVGDRLGGHFVSGHVDGVGVVAEVIEDDSGRRLRIQLPEGLRRFVAMKGSITIQGVSLTVSDLFEGGFEVALIPHTLVETTLDRLGAGDKVNLEIDLLARYLDQLNLKSV